MATHLGRTTHPVVQALLAEAHRYSFYQALYLLESVFEDSLWQAVKCIPAPSLNFPASDLFDAAYDDEGFLCLFVNFLKLPPPETQQVYVNVLERFSAIIYKSLYAGWKKMHPARSAHGSHINSLSDAGFYQARVKHAAGLMVLLSVQFEADVSIKQQRLTWQPVRISQFGDDLQIGNNTHLGDCVLDRTCHLGIEMVFTSLVLSQRFLLCTEQRLLFKSMVSDYCGPLIDVELIVKTCLSHRVSFILGGRYLLLGQTTIL